ncbi:bifunctional 2-polyprenyl-6-hydroxyphenol methylase/3-demethylubiquinol 3-O-methyltransferase UbiG [Sphingorhabdus sp. EL138]|uniref:class I SAM-dependent methyltransferase n=1 Tax=Sphingorhabdus sp. EL138 TaxID=2073156 RepID=UPI0013A57D7E|nr:class I SAM-dependent methyltransferase [Sphingorhabdus sp. EL138]
MPELFSTYTTRKLWSDTHISTQMLKAHIDPSSDRASRQAETIADSVTWLDDRLKLAGKKLCDLGCGPGLYARQFHERGAQTIGVDISSNSIEYARRNASGSAHGIKYEILDYTQDPLPSGMDIFTLIYCDFCVLSGDQRHHLLRQIHKYLNDDGQLALDVYSLTAFSKFREGVSFEHNFMDGFWSPEDYVGLHKSFRYEREKASLDRYLIIQPDKHWEVYNWLQYFSVESIGMELEAAGFQIDHLASSMTGEIYTDTSEQIAIIASAI